MHRRLRLKRAVDFELLRREGKRWHHPLILIAVRANGQSESRFGFSTSRRVGKATSRNRVKRRLREILHQEEAEIEDGWDVLFIARYGAAEASFAELGLAVTELLQRAGLLKST